MILLCCDSYDHILLVFQYIHQHLEKELNPIASSPILHMIWLCQVRPNFFWKLCWNFEIETTMISINDGFTACKIRDSGLTPTSVAPTDVLTLMPVQLWRSVMTVCTQIHTHICSSHRCYHTYLYSCGDLSWVYTQIHTHICSSHGCSHTFDDMVHSPHIHQHLQKYCQENYLCNLGLVLVGKQ